MTIGCSSRSSFLVLCVALAPACSSSKKSSPDAPPVITPADASITNPLDSAALDASGEAQGEVGLTSLLTVSPTSIDLGSLPPAVPSPRQIIQVTATTDISDLNVILNGGELALENTSTCGETLAAGASCRVVVVFRSSTLGAKSDSVNIEAGGHTTIVPVTATVQGGDSPLTLWPQTPRGFAAAVGQSSWPTTFYVPNAGETALGPVTFEITGADAGEFSATAEGCDLIAPGAFCAIAVVFTPRVANGSTRTATLVATGPGPDRPSDSVGLTGTIHAFDSLWLTSPTSDLGLVAVGATGPSVTFTLLNSGDVAAGPFTVTLSSPEFVLTDDSCSLAAIPVGGTCTIEVALRPTSDGEKSAVLMVGVPSGSPAVKTLTGKGLAPSLDGGALDSGVLDAGAPAVLDTAELDSAELDVAI
jgi:hypothetical protein